MRRLIFGCGYLGLRVAQRWRERADEVFVATRSTDRAASFRDQGFDATVCDVTKEESLVSLPDADTVLFAVGYDRSAGPSIEEVYADGFRNVLERLSAKTNRVIYVSTTGVYGGAEGGWVDETTPPAPTRPGGFASLAAEEHLRASPFADRGIALRLAGIYGPGRIPFLRQLEAGEPIAAPRDGHVNLIHVEDAARVVVEVADARGSLPPVLCVSDSCPPLRGDYYGEVARLIGASAPSFVDPPADSPRAARAAADKRVRNQFLTQTLGIRLNYPDFRTGLASILGKPRSDG